MNHRLTPRPRYLILLLVLCACSDDRSAAQDAERSAAGAPVSSPAAGGPGASGPVALPTAGTLAPIVPRMSTPSPEAEAEACEVVQLTAAPLVPDMMIVLDRSGSMDSGGRWLPSVAAIQRITTALQARIRFGLALFPYPDSSAGIPPVAQVEACQSTANPRQCVRDLDAAATIELQCAPGAVVVPIAPNNAAQIASALELVPIGGTPTSATLEKIVQSYASSPSAPDSEAHPKFVLLVTDGAPTCPAGEGADTTQADIDASNAAVEALAARDVRSYVVGYDTTGPGNEQLASVLDGFAQRGDTGDKQHRTVEDEASLLATLEGITNEIASCALTLDKPPARADFLLVRLDGNQLNKDAPDGWHLTSDRTVELTGAACTQFRTGTHTLTADLQCEPVGPS
jgi:Mg-chelatase subunit ChlD